MMNYSNIVIDHFEQPRNVVTGCAETSLSGRAGSKDAGAWIEFCLTVTAGKIDHVGFRAWGCPYTIALGSWLTEQLPGQRVDDIQSLDLDAIAAKLEFPAEKWHCILAAEDALRAATTEVLG